jgi:uncharacterized iron-regulated membrane protein
MAHLDLDDQDEHVHIHDHRPSNGGIARGLFVGVLLIALPIGGYYLGSRARPPVMHAANPTDAALVVAPAAHAPAEGQPPADFAPGAGVTNPALTAPTMPQATPPAAAAGPPTPEAVAAAPACDPAKTDKDKEADKKTPGPNEGTLVVECVPTCQQVMVDGKAMGPSPLAQVILPAGKHELTATFGQGAPRKHEAIVTAGQQNHVGLAPVAGEGEHLVIDDSEVGCEPPYWVQADGTRIAKPACATR